VNSFDDLPVADGPDPIDTDDAIVLKTEILRLRESLLASNGRTEVLRDRIAELESRVAELAAANAALDEELGRNPATRLVRAIRRRVSRRS
jgi:hypothetical protein